MPLTDTQQQLKKLLKKAPSITEMQEPHRKQIIDELMKSSEEEMQIVVDALQQELESLEEDNRSITDLLDEMKAAEKVLKKSFLKDREKQEHESSEEETEALLAQLEESEVQKPEKKRKKILGLF